MVEKLEIIVSNDKIINITGLVGSGKTTLANKYKNSKDYFVVSLDTIYGASWNKTEYSEELKNMLQLKYRKLNSKDFKKHYEIMVNYFLNSNKKEMLILEGSQIYQKVPIEFLYGTLIILKCNPLVCCYRALKRDLILEKNNHSQNKIKLKHFLKNCFWLIKRRITQVRYYFKLKKYMKNARTYNNHGKEKII